MSIVRLRGIRPLQSWKSEWRHCFDFDVFKKKNKNQKKKNPFLSRLEDNCMSEIVYPRHNV